MIRYLLILFSMVPAVLQVQAALVLPKILGHNMVLQREAPVAIWGWAEAGTNVKVVFKQQTKATVARGDGSWKVYLDPLPASGKAATLEVSTAKDRIRLNNVLVGEVWLCSGQSNMEYAMRKLEKLQPPPGMNWPVQELHQARNPNIRTFLVERKKMRPDSLHGGWNLVTDPALRNFSQIGYFFAKELADRLKVPVGVISAAVPGSGIEPWMPREAMLQERFFRGTSGDAGKFYTTMIEPLIPFTLKGFCWYQGENNCFLKERLAYSYKMKALIQYWRQQWKQPALPFYYIQIAPYYYSKAKDRPFTVYSEPEFWEAQAAVLKIPHTVMIATIDLNADPADLHPVNKWEVAHRLAQSALGATYGLHRQAIMGPVFKSAVQTGGQFIIDFDHKGKGLVSKDSQPLNFFEMADANGAYHPATATIKDNRVWVRAAGVTDPVAVRFAWREDARPNLYNRDGLPAISFRTDNPITEKFE